MQYERNNNLRKNSHRPNDRIYYDDCNVVFKVCGVITFVWGIMVIFGVFASIIGAGGADAVADIFSSYVYSIISGIAMFFCGLYAYRMRYTDVSITGFLLGVLSAALSLILIGVLARDIPSLVAMAVVPSVSSVLICLEHARHAS